MEHLALRWSEHAWWWFIFFWVLALVWLAKWYVFSHARVFVGSIFSAIPYTLTGIMLMAAASAAGIWYFGLHSAWGILLVVYIAGRLAQAVSVGIFNLPFYVQEWRFRRKVKKAGGWDAYLKKR